MLRRNSTDMERPMKKLVVSAILLLGCLCIAQSSQDGYPVSLLRIDYSDGTFTRLQCNLGQNCRIIENTSQAAAISRASIVHFQPFKNGVRTATEQLNVQ
jgi:hypothetical protein